MCEKVLIELRVHEILLGRHFRHELVNEMSPFGLDHRRR